MDNQSIKSLEQTLFEAKKFGLDPNYIRQLEQELNQRIQKYEAIEKRER
ncbi:hypothetical protein JYK21_06465 [Ralstonia pickettii]|nr:hypothetical protein [Ralstonia pickettii]